MKIVLDGTPVAKNRHRCACAHGKAFSYDPQVKSEMQPIKQKIAKIWNESFESENKQIQLEASDLTKIESFSVSCTFVFPVPKSDNLGLANAKFWGLVNHNSKPDLDNLEKFYLDCCTGIIWEDDAQVVALNSKKYYAEIPRTILEIMPVSNLNVHTDCESVLKTFSPTRLKEFLNDAQQCSQITAQEIDFLVAAEDEKVKTNVLRIITNMITKFALKYADELKKIQKQTKVLHERTQL